MTFRPSPVEQNQGEHQTPATPHFAQPYPSLNATVRASSLAPVEQRLGSTPPKRNLCNIHPTPILFHPFVFCLLTKPIPNREQPRKKSFCVILRFQWLKTRKRRSVGAIRQALNGANTLLLCGGLPVRPTGKKLAAGTPIAVCP